MGRILIDNIICRDALRNVQSQSNSKFSLRWNILGQIFGKSNWTLKLYRSFIGPCPFMMKAEILQKEWTNFIQQDKTCWAKFSTLEVAACAIHLCCHKAKLPDLKLKAWPKQLEVIKFISLNLKNCFKFCYSTPFVLLGPTRSISFTILWSPQFSVSVQ
jgi:hypothetical protein